MKRFSEMSALELEAEMERLQEQQEAARKNGMMGEAEMLERKYYMAKAYTLSPELFQPGSYNVVGRSERFSLDYINGVMAWGTMEGNSEQIGLPISMLSTVE